MNDAIMPNFNFTGILGGRLSVANLQPGHWAIKPGVEKHPGSCHLLRPIGGTTATVSEHLMTTRSKDLSCTSHPEPDSFLNTALKRGFITESRVPSTESG